MNESHAFQYMYAKPAQEDVDRMHTEATICIVRQTEAAVDHICDSNTALIQCCAEDETLQAHSQDIEYVYQAAVTRSTLAAYTIDLYQDRRENDTLDDMHGRRHQFEMLQQL